jgi:hypothetical protein
MADLCTVEECMNHGRYCRLHRSGDAAPKKQSGKKDSTLEAWFKRKINHCTWICEECGESCSVYESPEATPHQKKMNSIFRRSAQAHLLPKALFPSVATHDLNHACLGPKCGCHNMYDKNWQSASKMKKWPVFLQRILRFVHLLPPEEYRKLPDIIRDEYELKNPTPANALQMKC